MTLTACLFALFCSLLLPAGAGTYLALRTKKAAPVLLGAACFTVFQLLTRLPLLQLRVPARDIVEVLAGNRHGGPAIHPNTGNDIGIGQRLAAEESAVR